MRVIFLDIDGVLAPIPRPFDTNQLKESCVAALEIVLQSIPDVKIIISSTWRIGNNLKKLRETLKKCGFRHDERIIGKTLDYTETGEFLYLTRGQEISTWLMDQPSIESYCIIDDDTDISPHQRRWVQPVSKEGFNNENAEQCIKILKKRIVR